MLYWLINWNTSALAEEPFPFNAIVDVLVSYLTLTVVLAAVSVPLTLAVVMLALVMLALTIFAVPETLAVPETFIPATLAVPVIFRPANCGEDVVAILCGNESVTAAVSEPEPETVIWSAVPAIVAM